MCNSKTQSPQCSGSRWDHIELLQTVLQENISISVFNECHVRQKLPCSMEKAVIKVLPKMDSPQSVDDYRSISLINSDAKIFAHILAERAKQMFHNVIQKHQHAYLSGRQINLALSKISKSAGSLRAHDNVLININFTKAFDTIDRSFRFLLLEKLKVPGVFLNCVKALYRRTPSYVEFNGHISLAQSAAFVKVARYLLSFLFWLWSLCSKAFKVSTRFGVSVQQM